ncbi:MAG: hypothetical protein J3R72DRAFT_106270 [Linnemannia gamsii]|nr:MAG: hypothetical protein J3R72DRAFT_106270 [Linnemannia gamsii]
MLPPIQRQRSMLCLNEQIMIASSSFNRGTNKIVLTGRPSIPTIYNMATFFFVFFSHLVVDVYVDVAIVLNSSFYSLFYLVSPSLLLSSSVNR